MPQDMKIDYLELPADDLDAVQAFYSTVFGWTFEDWGEGYRSFSDGRLDGGFHKSTLRSDPATGAVLVVFRADDLDAALAAVEGAGGRVLKPPYAFPGGRRFHFADPAGNELAVWSEA